MSFAVVVATAVGGLAHTVSAAVTWQVQSDYRGTRDSVSQPRSLRGLALSPDDTSIYGGFIQGTSSSVIRKVSSSVISGTISVGSPEITGLVSLNGPQPKGLATDDRGYVYSTLNSGSAAMNQSVGIYNAALTAQAGSFASTAAISSQLGGIAVAHLGSKYYAYVARNGGAATIQRWDVTTIASPVLDTTWGSGGSINLKSVVGWTNAFLNGLEVDAGGVIYATGGILGTGRGDSVFKIAADGDLASVARTDVNGAMDLTLYDGSVYVAQYLANNSAIAKLQASDLASLGTLSTGFSHPLTDTDSGYSGIDVSSDGKLYVVDQIYDVQAPNRTNYDRILVSSPVPEPAGLAILMLGATMLLRRCKETQRERASTKPNP